MIGIVQGPAKAAHVPEIHPQIRMSQLETVVEADVAHHVQILKILAGASAGPVEIAVAVSGLAILTAETTTIMALS